jgi:ankyrin repeat protein
MPKRKYSELKRIEFFDLMRREAYEPDIDIAHIRLWVEENNFDINFVADSTLPNRTILNDFSLSGDQRAVQILLELGADVEGVTADAPNEPTALYAAVVRGYTAIVLLFLEHEANVNAVNQYQQTLLHQAAEAGHADIVNMLLSTPGINTQAIDHNGNTAMDLAREGNQYSVVNLLLNYERDNAATVLDVDTLSASSNNSFVVATAAPINWNTSSVSTGDTDSEIVAIMGAGATLSDSTF